MTQSQTAFGLKVVEQLLHASDSEWPEYLDQLRRDKQLAEAMRQINALLNDPANRTDAVAALSRIGLWQSYSSE